jgi:flagellin
MSVVINTNTAATIASNNLSASNAMLQRSLNRLSSGSKIVNASDDAGGVAVAARLGAASKRSGVVSSNISNAVSFLQNQDSGLKTMAKMVERMNELQSLYKDSTKSDADVANYETEFDKLKVELNNIRLSQFNGLDLFTDDAVRTVTVNDAGGTYVTNDPSDLLDESTSWGITSGQGFSIVSGDATSTTDGKIVSADEGNIKINDAMILIEEDDTLAMVADKITASSAGVRASVGADNKLTLTSKVIGQDFTIGAAAADSSDEDTLDALGLEAGDSSVAGTDYVGNAIADIAEARAQNGADQSVLGYYSELSAATKSNYESAVSKIMDVDVAEESTQLARWNTLVQAGTAMIAQANGSTQSALTLLR